MSAMFLDLAAAAEATSVSKETLKAAIDKGTLRAKRTGERGGGKYLVSVAALQDWFENGLSDA